ncbi:adenylate/guanylate cyclase domain-containing protein [Marinibacterium sp. SX1]|uniref:adenylate/guanylate cyclase domain-containing protein n=1 Tax=Marinibacterium sp. SX1 TaxID=3388424 RepID=UPI003D17E056
MSETTEQIVRGMTDRLLQCGLDGTRREAVLTGYCDQLRAHGLPLLRVHVAQRALHPEIGGFGFTWWREGTVVEESYPRSNPLDAWLNSPLFHILKNGMNAYRERLAGGPSDFPFLNELRASGATDYYARTLPFERVAPDMPIDPQHPPEGAQMTFAADAPEGFSEAHIEVIERTLPVLGVVLKSAAHRRMAFDLLSIYLGRDAGQRVISGEIQRGSSAQINAVIMFFDLEDFTSLAERIEGQDLVAMLNDYFGVVVATIEAAGGNVLKFVGDGLLAMFDFQTETAAADAALSAAEGIMVEMAAKTRDRAARGLSVTSYTLALHAGDLLYGNIGGEERLDFTVIGASVNLTARLSGMHKNVGRQVIVSDRVRDAARDKRDDLVSLGRYMLRGAAEPMELFTIHRSAEGAGRQSVG